MIILVTGIMRSGSTWSYNVALEIARRISPMVNCGYVESEDLQKSIDEVGVDEIGLFKCHSPSDDVISKIADGTYLNIITVRHPLDCVASRQQFVAGESLIQSVGYLKDNVAHVYNIIRQATELGNLQLVIRYEELVPQPMRFIQAIMEYMGVAPEISVIDEINTKTSRSKMREVAEGLIEGDGVIKVNGHLIDGVTCLHNNHINDGKIEKYVEVLGAGQAAIAESMLRRELTFLGYKGLKGVMHG